ncbi:hypothetical protein [Marinobacter sp.]|jgi:hypothetical protein|nr:hypothetical protein [Marinobacter sp.]
MKKAEQRKGAQDQKNSAGGGAAAMALAIVLIGVITAIGWSMAIASATQ